MLEYSSLACGIVALAIIVGLIFTFDAKAWITKDLKRGDLYALIDVASGLRPDGLRRDQASRLQARGMVRAYGNGHYCATIKGKLALRLRQAIRHAVQS
jgi:hypothetical protein